MLLLIALLIAVAVLYGLYHGKPLDFDIKIFGYLDSYDYTGPDGKDTSAYKFWNTTKDYIPVTGHVIFTSPHYFLNANSPVTVNISHLDLPPGFDVFLTESRNSNREFSNSYPMLLDAKGGEFNFLIGIRQNDIQVKILKPVFFELSIELFVQHSYPLKSLIRKEIKYRFHIGPDLGDIWVGLDPGTSGSCMAIGSAIDDIMIAADSNGEEIIASRLAFDKNQNFSSSHPTGVFNLHGTNAFSLRNDNNYQSFTSFKKLLGFNDAKQIQFKNGQVLSLKGVQLATLLVKGLFEDLDYFTKKTANSSKTWFSAGDKKSKRAVVAIPNNFTSLKTKEMISCITELNKFSEVRYVYEAEAVLFYYLSNYKRLNNTAQTFNKENILVFDMGGATINVTLVNAHKNKDQKYQIDLLSKIGYGIGGDTIDYCLIRFILSRTVEFPEMGKIKLDVDKNALADLALKIKKEIFAHYPSKDFLISFFNLQKYINESLNLNIVVNEDSKIYQFFKRGTNGRFKLFDDEIFLQYLYSNVEDAVCEVLRVSQVAHIDKIVFSGRSTFFPLIRETVDAQMKKRGLTAYTAIIFSFEESKSAVAQGACWYGINKNAVILNNFRTNAGFGFKKTMGDKTDIKFYEVLKMGSTYQDTLEEKGQVKIEDDFGFDGNKVNFYQVMGQNFQEIFANDQKHKFSKISSISIPMKTAAVGVKVNPEDDEVICVVQLVNNDKIEQKTQIADQEIGAENLEHYTWILN
ncbi:Hsp70 family protein [Pedobacter sp. MR2016-19]|uniref:Hsp70 family protein n=1 Tax=Pedobacter sp. MR2016-19 TaxID=2780089 RepID=UPI0018741235|nr:Hsp70 family protein [Pedobacter sp. MR2016-19]MBE5322027.1 Hsp70 family protein [Pedobacter sp. MR2016-19]